VTHASDDDAYGTPDTTVTFAGTISANALLRVPRLSSDPRSVAPGKWGGAMQTTTRAGLLAAAFALATAVVAPAGADPLPTKHGPNIRVGGTAAKGHDFGAAVAPNTTEGHFLVVWEDRLRNGTYGQLVKPDGERIKWNFRICDQGSPQVAYNSLDNEYLVVTEDLGIHGQLVDADGSLIGSPFEISGFDNGEWGVVAHNPATNRYLVVWRRWDIVGQLVDADGTLIGSSFAIDGPFATGWLAWPDVAANPTNGEFLVVWEDGRRDQTRDLDVFGQLVGQDGERLGSNIRISVRNVSERLPAVAYADATDQYLVVWQDERDPSRGADIYGRILTTDGERTGPEFRVSGGNATADDSWPDVAADPDGGRYFVTWMDQRNEATRGRDIFGQLLTATGARIGWNIRASGSKATSGEWEPAVAFEPTSDRYFVVWDDYRNLDTRGVDTYGQLIEG
jgi:hypothetical protein